MKIAVKKLEGSQAEVKVTLNKEEFSKYYDEAFDKVLADYQVEGFRKGKVPRNIYLNRVGSDALVLEEAVNLSINGTYFEAIQEKKVRAVNYPKVDFDPNQVKKDGGFTYTAVVDVYPEVELGEYFGIEYKEEKQEVSKEELERVLRQERERKAVLVLKEDGCIELGNTVVFDFEGFVDGVAFEGGKAENYALEIGSGQFIPGFEEQMLGMKEGEERELNVKFPDEYHSENLKGKDAIFKVKVHEIKEKQIPELNDEFVLELELDGVKTKEEYEKHVEAELLKGKEAEAKRAREKAIIQTICDNAKVDIPESLIDMRKSQMVRQVESQAKQYGLSLEQFLSFQGLDLEQYKEVLTEPAKASVTEEVVLDAIVSKEKIKLTKKELEAEIKKLAEHYQMEVEEFKSKIDLQELESYLAIDKAKALVFEKAIIK